MGRADENLRYGHASIRARHHLASAFLIAAHVDLPELDTLARQQPLGGVAIGAVAGGVNLDLNHDESRVLRILIWESGSPPQPGRIPERRRTPRPPATMPARRRRPARLTGARRRPAPAFAPPPRLCRGPAREKRPGRCGRARTCRARLAGASP